MGYAPQVQTERRTMYELLVLALLMRMRLHGYLMAKIANDMIGPMAKISSGTLYPLLTRLEQAGLIMSVTEESDQQRGERQLRTFEITEEGRKRFHQLMLDTTSNPGEYQKLFIIKALHLKFLAGSERLHLLDHYLNYCQTHILHARAEAQDLIRENAEQSYMSADLLERTIDVLQHLETQWQAEYDWTKRLREKEAAQIEAEP
jgi:DNA-binding PadR family transcriptional regulator